MNILWNWSQNPFPVQIGNWSSFRNKMSSLLEQTRWRLQNKLESVHLPPSSCGLIGAYCVCEALGTQYVISSDTQLRYIKHRAHTASVASYLSSRSCAGMTAETLADLTGNISHGRIHSQFFSTRGTTPKKLENFFRFWLQEKVVLVLTLNLQMLDKEDTSSEDLADAWHHQPLTGLEENGRLRMLYPDLEYSLEELHKMLDCESVLLVRAQDVLFQTSPKGSSDNLSQPRKMDDVEVLRKESDVRWSTLGVPEAVYELVRDTESFLHDIPALKQRKRIKIPAAYRPGVTVFLDKEDRVTCNKLDSLPTGLLSLTPEEKDTKVTFGERQEK